ncbi:MAG: CBS domain-containing protein [Candidatus Saccharibacteria bacterium]
MYIFLLILTVFTFILLLLFAALQPASSKLSRFELERRSKLGDKDAEYELTREKLLIDVISLQRVLVALLLVIVVLLSVVTFNWLIGVFVALFVALEYGSIARLGFLRNWSQKLYIRFEKHILNFIQKMPYLFKILRSIPNSGDSSNQRIDSREELQYLIDESVGVLTPDEKKLVIHGLSFGDQLVNTVMTPRSVIDSIKNTEFLGPLTLDDLHKTGHSRLPVIKGDVDHIIGILNLKSLLALDIKRSTTAEKAMDAKVYYIRQDQTLQHALAAFLRTHHHLFVVVNEFRETVGLLSLEDVIEALLGRKIIDEFDAHDNLREVALRNPRGNNHPEKREDV